MIYKNGDILRINLQPYFNAFGYAKKIDYRLYYPKANYLDVYLINRLTTSEKANPTLKWTKDHLLCNPYIFLEWEVDDKEEYNCIEVIGNKKVEDDEVFKFQLRNFSSAEVVHVKMSNYKHLPDWFYLQNHYNNQQIRGNFWNREVRHLDILHSEVVSSIPIKISAELANSQSLNLEKFLLRGEDEIGEMIQINLLNATERINPSLDFRIMDAECLAVRYYQDTSEMESAYAIFDVGMWSGRMIKLIRNFDLQPETKTISNYLLQEIYSNYEINRFYIKDKQGLIFKSSNFNMLKDIKMNFNEKFMSDSYITNMFEELTQRK